MSKIIVTSRYLKSGSGKKKQLYHYVKYIATREGSVLIPNTNETAPATKNQQELISSLLNDFPDSKELFEYEDYIKNPTVKNGTALISELIDRNMDRLTNRENYVGYLANRPGAVKFGSHGLFNAEDKPIHLEKTAKEIANHGGNVWTHVVSLRRDNAQAMGYDNLTAWRELVKRQIPAISVNQKIDMKNLKWYAAFHDKKTNPHVHIIVYSMNDREGFLTNHGIEKIRSSFANDIYEDELHHLYAQQTDIRKLLKKESQEFIQQLVKEISQSNLASEKLIKLISKLYEQLQNASGKKVYGYLKSEVKQTVDEIFLHLADNEAIKKMYSLWCKMEQQKHDIYSSARVQFPKLVDNKEFKSVKNIIIQTVLKMYLPIIDIAIVEPESIDHTDDDTDNLIVDISISNDDNDNISADDFNWSDDTIEFDTAEFESGSQYFIKWSSSYKSACGIIYDKKSGKNDYEKAEQLLQSETESGNILAIHDLGKLYSTEKLGIKDEDKSFAYYKEALQGFMEIEPNADFMFPYESDYQKPVDMRSYVWYRIGKMYCYGLGTDIDYDKSYKWFLKSAKEGSKFAQYSLGNLYYYGNGVEKDLSQAFYWYMKSAEQGQPYAAYAAAQIYNKGEYVSKDEGQAQKYYQQALSGFLKLETENQADDNLFYKIGMMYKNGQGAQKEMIKAIDYFKRSAELNNMNAKRTLALEYLSGEYPEQDIDKGLAMLTECADRGDMLSCYKLGKIYLKGEIVYKDSDMAENYFLKAAEEENEYALYSLGKLYLEEEKYSLDKAVEYLEKAVQYDEIRPYAAYSLAKILLNNNPYHDSVKAVDFLESAAMENEWASFLLGRLYLYGTDDIPQDKEKALECLAMSASQGNEYAQNMINNIHSFENAALANTICSLFVNLSRCIADDYDQKFKLNKMSADRKLKRMIQQKKQALGLKEEHLQNQELY